MNKQPEFIIDHREDIKTKNAFKTQIPDIKVEQLSVGDIVCGEMCIEHKSGLHDYYESIKDGRLFKQVDQMVNSYEQCAVLVSVNPNDLLTKNSHYGVCASLFARGAPMIFTGSLENTAHLVHRMGVKCNDGKERAFDPNINLVSVSDPQLRLITAIDHIGYENGNNLLNHFNNIESISNASMEELMEVKDIGPKLAKNIYQTFHQVRW